LARQILIVLASLLVAVAPARAQSSDVTTVEIQVGDNMRFTPSVINARPGEKLRIVLKGMGKIPKTGMAHNFVLLKRGVSPQAFADKSSAARDTEFIVPALQDQMIIASHLVGPGEESEVTFTAPDRAGEYVFLCTFPGHFKLGMKGQLIVK
jgi:azurin